MKAKETEIKRNRYFFGETVQNLIEREKRKWNKSCTTHSDDVLDHKWLISEYRKTNLPIERISKWQTCNWSKI